jgi:hypothetical protein
MKNKTQFMKNLEVFQKYNINDKIVMKDFGFCIVKNFDSTSGKTMLVVFDTNRRDYCTVDPDDVSMIVN